MSTIKPLIYDAANARLAEQAVVIPPGYIDGLNLVWNSGTSISVTSGSAYIEGAGAVVNVPAVLTLSGLSLTASTWYHVYLYLNAGVPAIECVTTDPSSAYSGTARSKTGDSSRRYVGSFLTDSSSSICNFISDGYKYVYLVSISTPPFRVLNNGTNTSWTGFSFSSVAPITAIGIIVNIVANGTAVTRVRPYGGSYIGTERLYGLAAGAVVFGPLPVSSSLLAEYMVDSGGSCVLDVLGFEYRR